MTLRVLSRPGRITQAGHIMTIVRNVAGTGAADEVGRIRLLQDKKTGQEVRSKGLGWMLGFLGQAGVRPCGSRRRVCLGRLAGCGAVLSPRVERACGNMRPWGCQQEHVPKRGRVWPWEIWRMFTLQLQ